MPRPPTADQPHHGQRSAPSTRVSSPARSAVAVGDHRELDLADRRVQPRGRPEEPAGPPVGLVGEQLRQPPLERRGDRGCGRPGPTPSRPSTSRELRSLPISPSGCRAASARAVGSPSGSPARRSRHGPRSESSRSADAVGEQFRPGGVPGQAAGRGHGRAARGRGLTEQADLGRPAAAAERRGTPRRRAGPAGAPRRRRRPAGRRASGARPGG